ncbi:TPA: phage tail protein, partial [Pasteurella multocida]
VFGAMQLLYGYEHRKAFTQGNSYLNRYDDSDMPGGKYIMLSSSSRPDTIIYQSFAIEPNKYSRFALSYKIGTYNKRNGLCTVAVQLYRNTELVSEFLSEEMGNFEKSEWHAKQVAEQLPEGVTEIRFKINVIGSISNNAISFRDIVVRGGE